jgi:cytochrome c oxidase subunit 2
MLNEGTIFLTVTEQADRIKPLILYFCIAGSVVFLVVAGLVTYACYKYRGKPGDPEPGQTTGNTKIELFAVGISIALLVVALILSVKAMRNIMPGDRVKGQIPDVIIIGHQWWWQVIYPGTGVVTANEVHFPVGKKLLVELKSADVIHDWSVPAFGPKMDMFPGRNNYLWITIKKPGLYLGQCNQFCGMEHARMRIRAIAQTPEEFQRWLNENKSPAQVPQDSMAKLGARLFQMETCSSCHQIRGTEATSDVGPDLTHLMGRKTILSGMELNNKDNLEAWISNPQKIKPGAHMPEFRFEPDSIKAIVDYLSELK